MKKGQCESKTNVTCKGMLEALFLSRFITVLFSQMCCGSALKRLTDMKKKTKLHSLCDTVPGRILSWDKKAEISSSSALRRDHSVILFRNY